MSNNSVNIGDYSLINYEGKGHFSVVYLAMNNPLQKEVALKIQRTHSQPKQLLKEARNLSKVDSQYVVGVHRASLEDINGLPYILFEMDFIGGGTVEELYDGNFLGISDILRIARHTLHALGDCHRVGIIHRDIKPGNILVNKNDYILGDFGLSQEALTGNEMASAGYISHSPPETLKQNPCYDAGKVIGPTFDIYALGITLFRLLIEHRRSKSIFSSVQSWNKNFNGKTLPEHMGIPKYIPLRLSQIIRKSTAINPDDRYQSADEMMRDVERLNVAVDWQLPSAFPKWVGCVKGREHSLELCKVMNEWECRYKINNRRPTTWVNERTSQHKATIKRDKLVKSSMFK